MLYLKEKTIFHKQQAAENNSKTELIFFWFYMDVSFLSLNCWRFWRYCRTLRYKSHSIWLRTCLERTRFHKFPQCWEGRISVVNRSTSIPELTLYKCWGAILGNFARVVENGAEYAFLLVLNRCLWNDKVDIHQPALFEQSRLAA